MKITATPCRHGPPLSHPIVGDVIGFALDDGKLWISGDTVLYDGVRGVAARLDVDVAIIHVGGVQFPITGPARYTMTGADAVELAGADQAARGDPAPLRGLEALRATAAAASSARSPQAPAELLRALPLARDRRADRNRLGVDVELVAGRGLGPVALARVERADRRALLLLGSCGRASARRRGGRTRAGGCARAGRLASMRCGSPRSSNASITMSRGRSTSTCTPALPSDRQPSSAVSTLLAGLDDLRVDHDARGRVVLVVGQPVDEHPPQRADLRRRQPGAVGPAHQLRELGHLLRERGVELLDRPRALPEHRVAPLPDQRECVRPQPRRARIASALSRGCRAGRAGRRWSGCRCAASGLPVRLADAFALATNAAPGGACARAPGPSRARSRAPRSFVVGDGAHAPAADHVRVAPADFTPEPLHPGADLDAAGRAALRGAAGERDACRSAVEHGDVGACRPARTSPGAGRAAAADPRGAARGPARAEPAPAASRAHAGAATPSARSHISR